MRSTLRFVPLLLAALAPAVAPAAPMDHYDLASLWFEAQEVVLADEVSHQYRIAEWNETTTYEVTRIWKGTLEVGAQIEVFDDVYDLTIDPTLDTSDPEHPRQIAAPEREARAILFLVPAPPRLVDEHHSTPEGLWMKVPSGMRILAGGKVYRFEQWSNPGAYEPVPQGESPDDGLRGSLETVAPVDLATFEHTLTEAAVRAVRSTAALALPGPEPRNTALLALLPPARTFPPEERPRSSGFPRDALSQRLQRAIAESGDVDAYTEAMGRDVVGGFEEFDGRAFLDPDRRARGELLLAAALETDRPRHQRDAALRVLADWPGVDEADVSDFLDRVAPLLADADPWVRAAAATTVGRWLGAEGASKRKARALIAAALETETDPDVLNAYAWELMSHGQKSRLLDPLLRGERKLVLSVRPGPAVPASGGEMLLGYAFVCRDREDRNAVLSLAAVAVAADGTEHRSSSAEGASTTTTQGAGRGLWRFRFDEPLPAGTYQVRLEGSLAARSGGAALATATTAPLTLVVP